MLSKVLLFFVHTDSGTVAEVKRLRIRASDFEVKDVIGRGHFGEVQVVREKYTETVYAMKTLRKQETLAQPEVCTLTLLPIGQIKSVFRITCLKILGRVGIYIFF